MKVLKQFFCIKELKTYYVGDEYKGKRKDLKAYLSIENKQHPRTKKGSINKKS